MLQSVIWGDKVPQCSVYGSRHPEMPLLVPFILQRPQQAISGDISPRWLHNALLPLVLRFCILFDTLEERNELLSCESVCSWWIKPTFCAAKMLHISRDAAQELTRVCGQVVYEAVLDLHVVGGCLLLCLFLTQPTARLDRCSCFHKHTHIQHCFTGVTWHPTPSSKFISCESCGRKS